MTSQREVLIHLSDGRPRLLDLYSCAGGAARGYQLAGFHVTGVDIDPQPHYAGDEFHQADALTFPLEGFHAVHASPPCQAYTHARHMANRGRDDHPRHIEAIRHRLTLSGLPYVIENVVGAPLVDPVLVCGTAMGLTVKRHRIFESNIPLMAPPCACGFHLPKRFPSTPRVEVGFRDEDGPRPLSRYVNPLASGTTHELFADAMGIDWVPARGKRPAPELHEAIPPAYTEHIGGYLMSALTTEMAA